MNLAAFAAAVKRQWLIVVVCAAVAAAGSYVYLKTRPATYQATSVVLIPSAPPPANQGGTTVTAPLLPNPVTELEGPQVAQRAASTLGSETAGVSGSLNSLGELQITATSREPTLARDTANAYAKAFVAQRAADVQAEQNTLSAEAAGLQATIDQLNKQVPAGSTANPGSANGSPNTSGSTPTTPASIQLSAAVAQLQAIYQEQLALGTGTTVTKSYAGLPTTPVSSSKAKTVGLAAAIGLLVGLGIALVREQIDDRLRSASELGEISDLPLLAELPEHRTLRRAGRKGLEVLDTGHGALAESTRDLRTNLQFLSANRSIKHLAVTSPAPQDGKSFVAAHLAASWAQTGRKVVVVSSDLRRPSIESVMGLDRGPVGLSTTLAPEVIGDDGSNGSAVNGDSGPEGSSGLEMPVSQNDRGSGRPPGGQKTRGNSERSSVATAASQATRAEENGLPLVATDLRDLWVVPSGPVPPNPAELLASEGMAGLLEHLSTKADLVILDTPPVLGVADAAIIGKAVDAVLVVFAEKKTRRSEARKTLRRLQATGSDVIGIVLNRSTDPDAALYYRYEETGSRPKAKLGSVRWLGRSFRR